MVTIDMMARTHVYADVGETQRVAFNPVGQIVGQMSQVRPVKRVIDDLLDEYFEAVERLNGLMPADA
jgi:hypothetical protein